MKDTQITSLEVLRKALKPGRTYRRRDLLIYSSNLDRHLPVLVKEGTLRKLRQGLYARSKPTEFGNAPPTENELLESFLRDNHFVVFGPTAFNSLGLGTTQVYNQRVVLNRKRHGEFKLGGRTYFFHRRMEVPRKLTKEFLFVEMLNRLDTLAEEREQVLSSLKSRIKDFDYHSLKKSLAKYGTYSTRLKLEPLLKENVSHGS